MGIGSITFSLPHFLSGRLGHQGDILLSTNVEGLNGTTNVMHTNDNICRITSNPLLTKKPRGSEDELLEKLPGLGKIKSLTEGNL